DEGRESEEKQERSRSERNARDEVRFSTADARARPVGHRAHNWLRECTGQGPFLREQADEPDRDLGIPVEVQTSGAVQEVVDGVRTQAAEAVDDGLAEGERSGRSGCFHARRSSAVAPAECWQMVGEKVLPHTTKP